MRYAYFKTTEDLASKLKQEVRVLMDHGGGEKTYQVVVPEKPKRCFWDLVYNDQAELTALGWINEADLNASLLDGSDCNTKVSGVDGPSVPTTEA